MRISLAALFLYLTITASSLALAVDTPLPDPIEEAHAKALFHEFRCVVCQSEAIADSPAGVAADMRRLIRAQLGAGKSDPDIKAYLVSRYGERVLMQPILSETTLLLWFGPLFVLLIGGLGAWRYFSVSASRSRHVKP